MRTTCHVSKSFFFFTNLVELSVEGLFSMGPIPASFYPIRPPPPFPPTPQPLNISADLVLRDGEELFQTNLQIAEHRRTAFEQLRKLLLSFNLLTSFIDFHHIDGQMNHTRHKILYKNGEVMPCCPTVYVFKLNIPPWILKQGGRERSGQSLISLNSQTLRRIPLSLIQLHHTHKKLPLIRIFCYHHHYKNNQNKKHNRYKKIN